MEKILKLFTFLFIFDGSRISRKLMWAFFIPYLILQMILIPNRDQLEILFIILVLLYSFIVVSIKRWKDRNKSAFWVILNFIPVINIWAAIELLLLKSVPESNK